MLHSFGGKTAFLWGLRIRRPMCLLNAILHWLARITIVGASLNLPQEGSPEEQRTGIPLVPGIERSELRTIQQCSFKESAYRGGVMQSQSRRSFRPGWQLQLRACFRPLARRQEAQGGAGVWTS